MQVKPIGPDSYRGAERHKNTDMNRLMTIAFLFLGLGVVAQEEIPPIQEDTLKKTNVKDTTRFMVGDTEFIIIDHDTLPARKDRAHHNKNGEFTHYGSKNTLTYWAGLDFGVNMLMDWNKTFDLNSAHLQTDPSSSSYFSINFLEQRIRLAKDYFGIVTGVGFSNMRFGFKDSYLRLDNDNNSTFGTIDSSLISGFSKNQLRVNYFNVPILFQINFSKKHRKNFHLAFGAIGSLRINSNTKYKYEVPTGDARDKIKGRYNLNPFQAQATVRAGFRNFGIFANYSLLPLFEKDKSEVAYPLTFGASVHF
jgi:hypothetical protein